MLSKYDLFDTQPLGTQGNIDLGAKGVVQVGLKKLNDSMRAGTTFYVDPTQLLVAQVFGFDNTSHICRGRARTRG